MNKNGRNTLNFILILGVLGCIAGITLIVLKSWFIGICGSIASAGLAYKGYQDLKK